MLEFKGMKIKTERGVYEPAEDSFMAAEATEDIVGGLDGTGKRVLDLGTGTGILGIVAASSPKVKSVEFADINEKAVSLAKENCELNRNALHAECMFTVSDLFSNINGTFDVIIFNAPYLRHWPGDRLMGSIALAWDGGKDGIEVSIRFLENAKDHMKHGCKVLLVASSLGNLKKLEGIANSLGYKTKVMKKQHAFFEDIVVFLLETE